MSVVRCNKNPKITVSTLKYGSWISMLSGCFPASETRALDSKWNGEKGGSFEFLVKTLS